MKYRYIVATDITMDTPVNKVDMVVGNRIKNCSTAIRIEIPDNLVLDKDENDIYTTTDTRTLRELNGVPMIKYNSSWTKCPSFTNIAPNEWAGVLKDSRNVPTVHRGYITVAEYKELVEDYKMATRGVLSLQKVATKDKESA